MTNIGRYRQHYSALLSLGMPIVIGQLGIILVSFADTMMVGHYDTNSLAAASFVNNIFNLAIIFATGYSYGLTPIVGNNFGKRNFRAIGRILKNSLATNSAVGIALTAIMTILYFNLHRLGQPEELMPLIRPYYIILLISLIFIMLFNSFKQFADGITDTKTSMWILIAGNILNIAGNWILIYGKAGLPEMGLLGAGISTLFSRIFTLAIFIIIFLTSKKYKEYRQGFKEGRINGKDLADLNKMGLPVGVQMGMETSSFSLATIMVGWLGTVQLAAHQIMLTVGQLGFMLYYGLAAAIAVRTSHFHGQNDTRNVRDSATAGFQIIMIMAVIVGTGIFLTRNILGSFFTDNAEVAAIVSQLTIPFIIYQLGDGMQCAYSNALRGIYDVKPVVLYAFIAYFAVSLPSGYLFGFTMGMGLTGIWLSFPLGLTTAGILFMTRFYKKTDKFRP